VKHRRCGKGSSLHYRHAICLVHCCVYLHVAACCSVLQRVARCVCVIHYRHAFGRVHCCAYQHVAVCCRVWQYVCSVCVCRSLLSCHMPRTLLCIHTCCSVLQCVVRCVFASATVAVCCSVLQCVVRCVCVSSTIVMPFAVYTAVRTYMLQCVAECGNMFVVCVCRSLSSCHMPRTPLCVPTRCSVLQCVAGCCSALQCIAACCRVCVCGIHYRHAFCRVHCCAYLHVTVCCRVWQYVCSVCVSFAIVMPYASYTAVCTYMLQCVAVCYSV